MLDYVIVPSYGEFNEKIVVFKADAEAEYAKIFLWESVSSLTSVAEAVRADIER